VIGVLQVAAMFAVGAIFFGLTWAAHPWRSFVLTVAVVLSAVCIGLAAAAYRIERGISIMLIVGALIAGCAFPADWLPPLLQTVNVVLPQTWAMQGYQDLITRGQGFVAVLPEIGVLLGFAAVFFGIAVRKFRSGRVSNAATNLGDDAQRDQTGGGISRAVAARFLTPLIFIAVMGATFGNAGVPTVAIYLVNEDEGRMGRQVVNALRDEPTLALDRL
jgi:hypothetical protein